MQLKAGKEYHRKTTGPHQMWATDASYFKVIGWGYYYMVTVMDDYSRFIIAHKLQRDMTSDSFIEVVQDAVDRTGMTEVPVADRTKLLSDNGSGYVSRAFGDYLRLVGIRHICSTVPEINEWTSTASSSRGVPPASARASVSRLLASPIRRSTSTLTFSRTSW